MSHDPEGQPLIYRWRPREGGTVPESWTEPVLKGKAPDELGEAVYRLYVIDGLRVSEPTTVRVIVAER